EKVSDKLEEMGVPEKIDEIIEVAKEKTAEAAGWVEEKAHNLKESLELKKEAVETATTEVEASIKSETPPIETNEEAKPAE
ncbi:MAG: hypothetical protein ACK40M_09615, partial [Flavobacteriales bacterium]